MTSRIDDDGADTLTIGGDGFVVVVRASPFAEAYGASTVPVCHLTRGVLESLAKLTLDRSARVVESRCPVAGAEYRRFEAHSE
jgi:predicted hydrocarbon binding protein